MKKENGFTLVELMLTLAVAAVVLAVGVPSFQTFVQNNTIAARTNEVVAAVATARSEAIRASTVATLCASSDQSSCNTTNWETGWIVFLDRDSDGAVDADDRVLQVQQPLGDVTVRSTGFDDSGFIQYSASGFIRNEDSGSFMICDDRGAGEARALNISITGRPELGGDANSDGTTEIFNGNAVSCPA